MDDDISNSTETDYDIDQGKKEVVSAWLRPAGGHPGHKARWGVSNCCFEFSFLSSFLSARRVWITTFEAINDYLDDFYLDDGCEIFGIHANAANSSEIKLANPLLSMVHSLYSTFMSEFYSETPDHLFDDCN